MTRPKGLAGYCSLWDESHTCSTHDEMVKAAAGIKEGTATAEAVVEGYNQNIVSHLTYKALAEVGKAEKTIFLCDYLSSRETQYEVNDGLQVVENWNSTNEFIC